MLTAFPAIVRSERGNVKIIAPARARELADWNTTVAKTRAVLERLDAHTAGAELSFAASEELADELLVFESRDMRVTPHFKMGLLYCAKGQTTEEEMFCNQSGSKEYDAFLELIGQKVPSSLLSFLLLPLLPLLLYLPFLLIPQVVLAGWNRFPGGLDTRGTNTTGTHSVFSMYSGYDVMFHVSTMFPFSTEGGEQQARSPPSLPLPPPIPSHLLP